MKRGLLFAVALLLTMGAHAQKRNLFLNKDSGIYGKGERSVVTYRGEALAQDSLTVRVMSNNRLVLTDRIWPEGTDFTVFAATIDSTCAIMVEMETADRQTSSITNPVWISSAIT